MAVGKRFSLIFNADGLIPNATGQVTLRFRVSDPLKILHLLGDKGVAAA